MFAIWVAYLDPQHGIAILNVGYVTSKVCMAHDLATTQMHNTQHNLFISIHVGNVTIWVALDLGATEIIKLQVISKKITSSNLGSSTIMFSLKYLLSIEDFVLIMLYIIILNIVS